MSGASSTAKGLELLFDGGMDQRQHPRQMQPPTALAVVNARWRNSGGIEKRYGTTEIGGSFRGGYALTGAQAKVIGFRDELLVADRFRMGTLSLAAGTRWFQDKGKVPECTSRARPIDTTQYNVFGPDILYANGLIFHTWCGGAKPAFTTEMNIYTSVEDAETGALIVSSQEVRTGIYYTPHLGYANGVVFLAYCDSVFVTQNNVYVHIWDFTTMTWGPANIISNTADGDMAMCTDGLSFYFVWRDKPTQKLRLTKVSSALAVLGSILCTEPAGGGALGLGLGICANQGERVWLSFNVTAATSLVKVAAYDTGLSTETIAPFTIHSVAGTIVHTTNPVRRTSSTALIAIGLGGTSYFPIVTTGGVILNSATTANRTTNWVTLGSKPFVVAPASSPLRVYCWAYVGGANADSINAITNTYTFMLLDLLAEDSDTTQARWAPRPITWEAPRYSVTDGVVGVLAFWAPPNVAQISAEVWDADFVVRKNARTRTGLSCARIDFASPDKLIACDLGQTLFVTPGFYYDRDKLQEIGFAYYPQGITVAVNTVGGSYGATTRTYIAMYEYVDANGFVHRSLPSPAVSASSAVGVTNQFEITVPMLTITTRQSYLLSNDANAVRIVIYVQSPSDGIYRRLFFEGQEGINNPRLRTITIIDTGVGLATEPREILYKQSGVFGNVMPNAFTSCVTYRNRVWIAYGRTVMYSKAFVTGEAVSFADEFELPLEEGNNVTALWKMDDALFISTRDSIYFLQADGPNDFGQQNDITTPNQVATDRGCIDQRSIAVTPIGTIYQSSVGIQQLDRGKTVAQEPIGSRVQKDLAAFPTIVSTNVHPTGRYAAFACRNASNQGIRLVFDYALNRWSRDTLWSSSTDVGEVIYSETIAEGVVYSAIRQGSVGSTVVFEDATTHLDDGVFMPMGVELAEMHPAGLQSHIACRNWQIFNDFQTAHDLTMSWYKDYEASPFQTVTWTSAEIGLMPREQSEVNVPTHQCQSMRMTIKDAAPTGPGAVLGTGKGATFLGVTVDVDTYNMTYRLGSAQKK